jgi:hypothetical protein
MWGAIFATIAFAAFGIGTIWYSIATGRLVYRGEQHITREADPDRFWRGIAWSGILCAAGTALPLSQVIHLLSQ